MAKWLEQAFQWHEMYWHDLEVMSLNPSRIELGVCSTSVQVIFEQIKKHIVGMNAWKVCMS